MNVVIAVGFGQGKLTVSGPIQNQTDFLIVDRAPIIGFQHDVRMFRIPYQVAASKLSFEFFKETFICAAQPWMCTQ